MYKTTRVKVLGDYIVVFRKRKLKNGQCARESPRPIHAKDVVAMTELNNSYSNSNSNITLSSNFP
jgi:hypothetical protein